jgi:ABC-type multidrug transport system ATPase subunit
VHDIRVARGGQVLVDGVSFRVAAGTTTLLFGPSGSGKSLLLKSIVGLVPHEGGAVDLAQGPSAPLGKQAFGYVPQDLQLYPALSALENVLYFAGQFGIPRKEARRRALELLGELGLREAADRELHTLSGGQQRRVSVATALVHQPRVLVMDEPSSGLDFAARRTLWELLRRLAEAHGIAVLASTHFIDEAEYATEVGILHKGKLVAKGSTASLVQALPGQGRCVEIHFDTLTAADHAKLRALLPQLKAADVATTASYRLFSARYYAKAPAAAMARLPGLLRAAGLSPRSSSLEDVGLEDVFTFLTGEAVPEAGP